MQLKVKSGGGFVDYCPHPVGSWLHCEFDPNAKWPGTVWTRYGEGTYLVSSGATYQALSNYGANTHTLSAAEMPAHTHVYEWPKWTGTNGTAGNGFAYVGNVGTQNTTSAGSGRAHNNMPYSVAVPLWRRTK